MRSSPVDTFGACCGERMINYYGFHYSRILRQ